MNCWKVLNPLTDKDVEGRGYKESVYIGEVGTHVCPTTAMGVIPEVMKDYKS